MLKNKKYYEIESERVHGKKSYQERLAADAEAQAEIDAYLEEEEEDEDDRDPWATIPYPNSH